MNLNTRQTLFRKIGIPIGLFLATLSASPLARGEILVKDGDSIAFLGDSITQLGWDHPYGYVHLVVQALAAQNIKVKPLPAGISGNTSADMLGRVDGVLGKAPTWMTLSCGFNDVSPYCTKRVNLEDFKTNVTGILDKAQAAGVKVIVLTPTVFQDSKPDGEVNQEAIPYIEFLRKMAKERNLPLADLNAAHRAELLRLNAENLPYKGLQCDGLHMNLHGDQMMATGVLKTLGLTEGQIAQAKDAWENNLYRREAVDYRNCTVRQFEAIEKYIAKEKLDINGALVNLYKKSLIKAAQASPAGTDFKTIEASAEAQFSKDMDELEAKQKATPAAP